MVLGGSFTFTAAGTSTNVFEGTRFGIAFKQGPIMVLARVITKLTASATQLPFVKAAFTTGTSIVSEQYVNQNIETEGRNIAGLSFEDDEIVDENIPTGNISLTFTSTAACVGIWRAFTPGLT